jgi:PAS domain S-box-containing protein
MSDTTHPAGQKAPSAFSNSAELYRLLFEQATDGIFIADPQLRFLAVNPRGTELIGYSSEELLGMGIPDLIPPEDLTREPLRMDDLRRGRIVTSERRLRSKDGRLLSVEVSVRVIPGGNLLGIVRDITERRRAEAALLDSEARYRKIFEANPHPMWVYDLETLAFLEVNDAAVAHYGFSREEFLSRTIADIRPPEDVPRLFENISRVGERPVDKAGVWRHCRKDGTVIEVEITSHVLEYLGRRAELVLANDISERRRVESALSRREERLRLLTDNMVDAISQINAERQVVWCSPSVERVFGLKPEDLIGRNAYERVHPEDAEGVRQQALAAIASRKQSLQTEYRYLHGRGDYVWVESSIRLLFAENGEYAGAILGSRDINEKKLAEQRLRESEERMRLSLSASGQGLYDLNVQTGAAKVSPEYARMLGYDPAEFHETNAAWIERLHPEDRERTAAIYRDYIAGRIPAYQTEFRQRCRSGEWKWILSLGEIVERDAQGKPLRMLGTHTDITERKLTEEALRQANLVVENSPVVLFRWQAAEGWPVAMVSQNVIQFGYTQEELLSGAVPFAMMVHPEDMDRVGREVQEYSASGAVRFQQEYRIVTKDGRVRWVDDRTLVERNAEGEIVFYQGIVIDITERKQVVEELSRQTTLFRNLFGSSPEAIAVLDHEDRVLEVNRSFESLFGYSQTEARGRSINDLVAPEQYLEDAQSVSHAVIGSGRVVEKEGVRCTKEGRPIDVALIGYPIVVDQRLIGAYAIYRDITERKRAEEELKKAHRTFLKVLDGIDATIYVADMNCYEILFMNKNMINTFGADLTGRICYEAFRRERGPCSHCPNDKLVDADGNPTGVYVWECQNPITEKWYINYDRAIEWVDGRLVRLQIATDISKIKELEQERVRMEDQLRQAQKMESVGRLAGGVAHDFNNMLSAILGHAELAMMQVTPSEPILDDLKAIKRASLRSADLVRQLLAFARKQAVAPKVLELNDTVAGMLKMLQRLIGEDIDLVWKPGADLWAVKIDPSQIDQVLANLCVNARDAIAGVGKVTIQTENAVLSEAFCADHPGSSAGDHVVLAVSDDGCGMNKEVIDHIFEPFFTTKEVGKGTGLGLATVYGIVKQNAGFINVHSEPGAGATFTIYLPRFMGNGRQPMVESRAETPKGRGEMVLLVEDEAAILQVARVMLEGLGYAVVTAGTPVEALRQAQAHPAEIRLLITDVIMPEMNGRDLAEKIRALAPGVRILFASGYTENVIAQHGVLDEGVQFLPKPFSLKELAVKVRRALE